MNARVSRFIEVALIRIAIAILQGRNINRCLVVTRPDNNRMHEMGNELRGICERMSNEYEGK